MTNKTVNTQQAPYLLEQRQFPSTNVADLANQVDIAYVDIAQKVNAREIGLYALGFSTITGESWYFSGSSKRQQSLRQVLQFTAAGPIAHNINFNNVSQFIQGYGSYTDGTNYYGVIYATSVNIAGQVTFWVDPTNINVIVDGAAPVPVTGTIVIEWLSNY